MNQSEKSIGQMKRGQGLPENTSALSQPFWSKRPWIVVSSWVFLSLAIGLCGWFAGMRTVLPGPSSLEALKRYEGERVAFSKGIPPTDNLVIVLRNPNLLFDNPPFQEAVSTLVELLKAQVSMEDGQPLFESVRTIGFSIFIDDRETFVSEDGHAVLIFARSKIPLYASASKFKSLPTAIHGWEKRFPEFETGYLSEGTGDNEIFDLINEDLDRSLVYTLPLTLLILLWAFRSVVAALIPLFIGIVSLIASLGLSAFFSHLSGPVSATAAQLVVLLVLAIGVDYSLFMVSRVREELSHGALYGDAVRSARSAVGMAIVWSGVTVACSLVGLLLMDDTILTSMAHVSIIAVLYTVFSTVLVLPSLLVLLARFIAPPKKVRDVASHSWVSISVKHPVLSLAVTGLLMAVLSYPLIDIKLGSTVERDVLPKTMQSANAYSMLKESFPDHGGSDFWVIMHHQGEEAFQDEEVTDRFVDTLLNENDIAGPFETTYSKDRTTVRYKFVAHGNGNVPENQELISKIREHYIPEILSPANIDAYVTGVLPFVADEVARYNSRTAEVLVVVLILSFLFLLVAFHSLAIALKAILLNTLSASAAFGLLVLFFQEGLVAGWNYGVIESFVPALLFCILFGLSMDYHVFLLSRIREEMQRSDDTKEAVKLGITSTYRTITSAALIMAGVFFIIANLELPVMKQLGLGLAIAVLLDATIVRSILLPATMVLLGEWNWYLPPWLRWLPEIHLEGSAPSAGAE